MKTFGKILVMILIFFVGIQLFGFLSRIANNKAIGKLGDEAIVEENDEFFRSIFEYYQEGLIYQGSKGDFNLNIYNVATKDNNLLLFLATGIDKKITNNVLNFSLKLKSGREIENILISIGEEAWYLQWLYLENLYDKQQILEDIVGLKITYTEKKDEEVLVFEDKEAVISESDYNIVSYLKGDNTLYAYLDNIAALELEEKELAEGETNNYKLVVKALITEEIVGDVYLIGNFNDYDINDKSYKLTKSEQGISYKIAEETEKTTFFYQSEGEKFQAVEIRGDTIEYLFVIDGEIAGDENGEPLVFEKKLAQDVSEFSDSKLENYLASLGVYKVDKRANLKAFNYIVWIGMIVYIVVLGGLIYMMFIRQKPTRAAYSQNHQTAKAKVVKEVKPQENININKISEIEERDENLAVKKIETTEKTVDSEEEKE
ncbi:MAG: hypothetical protein RBS76_04030 [Acholeplasmatales bacterium]|jgi:hypothetical protein|nr:hypothetical protein [Acholeplasmataceae bacterium]MDY0115649.1 hypothetical protein [Acholeplasmatales bacterium]MCK9234431.1 hypothetical protein [Acholeplasmataceae bacterium]MCK9289311.1 hypothetical protein [Acholeplasmataceae bacterium]MCK9427774.1 hypothetical protein [Acholeplasmataceae bacterium]